MSDLKSALIESRETLVADAVGGVSIIVLFITGFSLLPALL